MKRRAPIGQEAQPAADRRARKAAEAVTGYQRVRDIDETLRILVFHTAKILTENPPPQPGGFFLPLAEALDLLAPVGRQPTDSPQAISVGS